MCVALCLGESEVGAFEVVVIKGGDGSGGLHVRERCYFRRSNGGGDERLHGEVLGFVIPDRKSVV